MAWEKRTTSNRSYYTKSRRHDGRVKRQYVGPQSDPVVRIIAAGDALNRAESKAAVVAVRAEQDRFKTLEPLLDDLVAQVQESQEISLLVCGYRRRKGALEAVRFREYKSSQSGCDRGEVVTRELFQHLARRANLGDRAAAVRLREILEDNPEIWQGVRDLAQHAKRSLIDLIADGNAVLREAVSLQVEELHRSLRQEATDETLERMLIDHIVVCWLELYFVRTAAMQPQKHNKDRRFWEQRLKNANARFHSALKELAMLRGLLGRAVDVVSSADADQD